jgi:fructokinase
VNRIERPRVGVDLGGSKIEAILLDGDGTVRGRLRRPTPRGDYAATVRSVAALVEELVRAAGTEVTVGIGTPGALSPASGRIKNANSVWLNGRALRHDLERELGREVRLANDADCFALSEATDGAGRGAEVVFGVILGTGVGGGIVVRGRLLRGPNAIAGEWGHNPLPWPVEDERPGPSCYCGRSGCIETFLSGPGLERDHASATGVRLTAAVIAERAAAGDAAASATLERYAERLARALASVINVLDPHVVVLGGGLSNVERLYARVPELWSRWVFSDRVDTRLVPPFHGDSSGVRGAARLWELPE